VKCELSERAVAHALGLLDSDDHVESCAPCQALRDDALLALDGPPQEVIDADAADAEGAVHRAWEEVARRIESDRAGSKLRIVLGCAYCHDRLARDQGVYCAACLTPHHAECFREHGTCCAPGCGGTRVVDTRGVEELEPRRDRPKPVILFLALLLAGGVAAFSLVANRKQQAMADRARRAAAVSEDLARAAQVEGTSKAATSKTATPRMYNPTPRLIFPAGPFKGGLIRAVDAGPDAADHVLDIESVEFHYFNGLHWVLIDEDTGGIADTDEKRSEFMAHWDISDQKVGAKVVVRCQFNGVDGGWGEVREKVIIGGQQVLAFHRTMRKGEVVTQHELLLRWLETGDESWMHVTLPVEGARLTCDVAPGQPLLDGHLDRR
jgi:hypothetical protein